MPKPPKLTPEQWRALDWTKQDIVLHRELGVTRERVRQVRLELGKPKSPDHHYPTVDPPSPKRDAILTMLDRDPLPTVQEIVDETGCAHSYAIKTANSAGVTFRDFYPWDLMNWDLPNVTLMKIWRIADPPSGSAGFRFAKERYRQHRGPAKWSMLKRRVTEADPAYQRALEAERAKANKWFKEQADA